MTHIIHTQADLETAVGALVKQDPRFMRPAEIGQGSRGGFKRARRRIRRAIHSDRCLSRIRHCVILTYLVWVCFEFGRSPRRPKSS